MTDTEYLRISGISKSYGDVAALTNISIDIAQGELVSFIGPSGCGKTTLLRTIGGFHAQDSGSVTLDEEVIDALPPEKRATGMVFQSYALFPHMSVAKNVAYGLGNLGVRGQERKKRVDEALAQVRLEGYGDRRISELSGGQQQRVAIARCLVLRPKVLLLDEPLSNLDANLRVIMRDEIRRIKDELDITVLFVTHDQEEALSISDRVLVLSDGQTQQIGAPTDVYDFPENEFVATFVGQANLFTGRLVPSTDGVALAVSGNEFPVSGLTGKRDGQAFTVNEASETEYRVLVRPERVRIDPTSSVRAQVTKIVYNGSFTRYSTRVGELEITVDESNSSYVRGLSVGDSIGISMPTHPYLLGDQLVGQ